MPVLPSLTPKQLQVELLSVSASPGNATTVRPWFLILFRGLVPFSCRPPRKTRDSHETPGCIGRFQSRTGMFTPFSSNCYAHKTPSFYFAKLWRWRTFLLCWNPTLQHYLREDGLIKSFKNNIYRNGDGEYELRARPLMYELSQHTEEAPSHFRYFQF